MLLYDMTSIATMLKDSVEGLCKEGGESGCLCIKGMLVKGLSRLPGGGPH